MQRHAATLTAAAAAAATLAILAVLARRARRPPLRLTRAELPSCPFELLKTWMTEAERELGLYARAMVIATYSSADGPTARTVLMQVADAAADQLVFGSSLGSQKMRQLQEEPRLECVFRWGDRQCRVRGRARIEGPGAATEAAYGSLPLAAQLSLHVLRQGAPIDEAEHAAAATSVRRLLRAHEQGERLGLPAAYTAVSIEPCSFEFYQGGGGELGYAPHDRFLFVRDEQAAGGAGRRYRLVSRLQA
mmetsp:Transcript_24708/g.79427  ORF Transcript_24708/g.79427 Transcript_24708/m.79427 type:complete len:248 (+) Transcript_24708:30-773(+)